jgi:hypothetical protein
VQFSSNSIDHLPTHYIVGIFPLTCRSVAKFLIGPK